MLARMSGLFRIPPAAPVRKVAREQLPLHLPDGRCVTLLRVRDPRARRIRLSVPEGGPRLTLPLRASLLEAERFLAQHLHWIAEELDRQAERQPALPPLRRGAPGSIDLRGTAHALDWTVGRYARAERDGHCIRIALPATPAPGAAARALRELLLAEMRADLARWLPRYLPGLPRPPSSVRIRPLASLWGSLSASGAMSLDLALILAPPPAFEYVLVHELCHLIEHNHSRAFWREVDARCPDWRRQRAWFRAEGMALKASLQRVLTLDSRAALQQDDGPSAR